MKRTLATRLALMIAAGAAPCVPAAALASPAAARLVALSANCKPGKVEALRQIVGGSGETVFKVSCIGGKSKDAFVIVQCREEQCVLLK